jgi:hypothetical protein
MGERHVKAAGNVTKRLYAGLMRFNFDHLAHDQLADTRRWRD